MARYKQVHDGEWVAPVRRGYKMACCDCGLVHRVDFEVVKRNGGKWAKPIFRAWRDARATALTRRRDHRCKPVKA